MPPSEILGKMKALLEKPGAWAPGAEARRGDGSKCSYDDPLAVSWSSPGAADFVGGKGSWDLVRRYMLVWRPPLEHGCTQQNVLDRLVGAIAVARVEEMLGIKWREEVKNV